MAVKENQAIVRDFLDRLWNRKDMSAADDYIDANLVPEGPMSDQFPPGPAGSKAFAQTFLHAFPNVTCSIDRQEVEDDLVYSWLTYRGTHTGPLMDIPATGRQVTVQVVTTDRVRNGKIVQSGAEWDPNDMFRQLGVG